MKPTVSFFSATLWWALAGPLEAQILLVDWDHSWDYMHPISGLLPAGSGPATPHPDGSTPWYAEQSVFEASYEGPSFAEASRRQDAGNGPGPIGYGAVDYTGDPLPPPAEFAGLGTTLTTPPAGDRFTAYFRTTFTVPNDGEDYDKPVLRYILDDGGFVYLDGELILEVNVAGGLGDDYLVLAPNTTNTESHIRDAELSLEPGAVTGGNSEVFPEIVGNAVVGEQVLELEPGVHTLAVAVHNQASDSSDLLMAVQLWAGQPECALDATASHITRDQQGTLNDPSDDTVGVMIKVVPSGTASGSWEITAPVGSGALGQGGAYNEEIEITGIAMSEFTGGPLALIIEDGDDPTCFTRVNLAAPLIIATDDRSGTGLPVLTTGSAPIPGWVINETARTMTMNNGGGGARQVITSAPVDLSNSREVQFSGVLEINDTSSGNEADDGFVAFLILDGDTANPVNLIEPHDTLTPDGVLIDDELAPAPGNYVRELNYLIPANVKTAQVAIEGINNSNSETFVVRDLTFTKAPDSGERLYLDVESVDGNLVFTWESGSGELYNLRSETSLDGDPLDWPLFEGNSSIAATPPFNTLTVSRPADPHRLFVIEAFPAPPESVFRDDFEGGQGEWTTGSDGAEGTSWELGVPDSGPRAPNSPVNCFATNLDQDYDLNADVWLRSPSIDLTTAGRATIRYAQYYDIEAPDPNPPFLVYDFGQVSILDADDDSVIAVLETNITGFLTEWEEVSTAVPEAALGKAIKIEFRLQSDEVANFPGWYLDDFEITVP